MVLFTCRTEFDGMKGEGKEGWKLERLDFKNRDRRYLSVTDEFLVIHKVLRFRPIDTSLHGIDRLQTTTWQHKGQENLPTSAPLELLLRFQPTSQQRKTSVPHSIIP